MTATPLGLYELLAPQFLLGFTFPAHIDRYLALLSVESLRTHSDDTAVIYTGRVAFGGEGEGPPVLEHRDPSGALFEWQDVALDFRLTLPRDGASFINDAATELATRSSTLAPGTDRLSTLLQIFGEVEQTPTAPTEFPGVRFRLELMLSLLTFHLGNDWVPGRVEGHRIVPDPWLTNQSVKFVLPKMVFEYEQGDDLNLAPSFRLKSWGNSGFDAASDLEVGELIRMEPPLALHKDGRWGFGIDQVLLDFSADHTPPEILQFYGMDEAFEGLYFKSLRFYYNDDGKNLAFHTALKDALISTVTGEVSFEFMAVIFRPENRMSVTVRLVDGDRPINYTPGEASEDNSLTLTGGRAEISQRGIVQMEVQGGVPPFITSVTLEPAEGGGGPDLWDPDTQEARLSPGMNNTPAILRPAGVYRLIITVEDSSSPAQEFSQTLDPFVVTATAGSDSPPGQPSAQPPQLRPASFELSEADRDRLRAVGYSVQFTSLSGARGRLRFTTTSAEAALPTVQIDGRPLTLTNSVADVEIPADSRQSVTIATPALLGTAITPPEPPIYFNFDHPLRPGRASRDRRPGEGDYYQVDTPTRLQAWLQDEVAPRFAAGAEIQITLIGRASDEGPLAENPDPARYNLALSQRRIDVVQQLLESIPLTEGRTARVVAEHPRGDREATGFSRPDGFSPDRVVEVQIDAPPSSPITVTGTLVRPPTPDTPQRRQEIPAPSPAPPMNQPPPVFKSLGVRVKILRNTFVLGEIFGSLDFETELEQQLRNPSGDPALSRGSLDLQGRGPNPADGIIDYKLTITHDPATHFWVESLTLGADPDDRDGLADVRSAEGEDSTDKNIFGALLLFMPLINEAAGGVSTNPDNAGDWIALVGSVAAPIAIGSIRLDDQSVFRTGRATLYGGELRSRQYIPPEGDVQLTDVGVIFDYGVEFYLTIAALNIRSVRPMKVRYRALGFNLYFGDPARAVVYQPIFDTSKGYELDLGDLGQLELPPPLEDILAVTGARLARVNPLNLEVDIGLKVNLGVITVDQFRVKLPLEPLGPPTITPTGVKVNLSQVLVGSGYLDVQTEPNLKILGTIDITLVQLKLRIAAGLAIDTVTDEASHRTATAVLATLTVEFPSPIVLGATGLGIFGFSGLFAMHYRRDEAERLPGSSVSPALAWLVRAGGDPATIRTAGGDVLRGPEIDRWSFGIGIILGTIEGGFLLNFRGMFVLELPGPRILIFVKIQIVTVLPSMGDDPDELIVGILGVVDLDFNLGQITVGVIIDLTIPKPESGESSRENQQILSLQLPVEIYFKLGNPENWHFYLGTVRQPASATILGIIRARGYFMVEGFQIADFPIRKRGGGQETRVLEGIAVALGIEAAIVLGNESAGIYLKIAAGASIGVAFSPFYIVGGMFFDGELRLLIIGIEAHGFFTLEAGGQDPADPSQSGPTYLEGEVCGKIDLFFFSISACIGFSIGNEERLLPAPDWVRGVYLQSHAPVVVAGQGGDRPIDAKLADAVALNADGSLPLDAEGEPVAIPSVPIDTILVLQLQASPFNTAAATTFTAPLVQPDTPPEGWVNVGSDLQVRYRPQEFSLTMTAGPVSFSPEGPPATWRRDNPPGDSPSAVAPLPEPSDVNTAIDLAIFSRCPTTGPRALERSSTLDAQVEYRWGGLCQPPAPAAAVLWTICDQPLGPSGDGWVLTGTLQPDPPDTLRHGGPATQLRVEEPTWDASDRLINLSLADRLQIALTPARVIGANGAALRCIDFSQYPQGTRTSPATERELVTLQVNDPQLKDQIEIRRYSNPSFNNGLSVTGLECGRPRQIWLTFLVPVQAVEITLIHFSQITPAAALVAMDRDRRRALSIEYFAAPAGQAQTLRVEVSNLGALGIISYTTQQEIPYMLLSKLCAEPVQQTICQRALRLPLTQRAQSSTAQQLQPEIEAALRSRLGQRWITLHTGESRAVGVYLAVDETLVKSLLIRQLDRAGRVLQAAPLYTFAPVVPGLPVNWFSPSGPWGDEVQQVTTYFSQPEFRPLVPVQAALVPEADCTQVQLWIPPEVEFERPLTALVGAVISLSAAEERRHEEGKAIVQGQIDTVTGYLDGAASVPLLTPGQDYTLAVRYRVESRQWNSETSVWSSPTTEPERTQEFRFSTDTQPPTRLDPWVMGIDPNADERFHFYEDPVTLLFNDLSVIQLFSAYGRQLQVVLRGADGFPIETTGSTTIDLDSLEAVPAQFTSPFQEALERLWEEKPLPCVGRPPQPLHQRYRLPFQLQPLMAYTLDLETVPGNPTPSDQPIQPLFQRSFSTSRFAHLGALVANLQVQPLRHRALQQAITGLPTPRRLTEAEDGVPVAWNLQMAVATDSELQQALIDAGEQPLPAPEHSQTCLYWLPTDTGRFVPHALLIDGAEPLWRSRTDVQLETVPDQDDPNFSRVVSRQVAALVLLETGSAVPIQFVRSPAGTRTLVLLPPGFAPPESGTRLQIAARQIRSLLFNRRDEADEITPERTEPLIDILLTQAPWEDDDA